MVQFVGGIARRNNDIIRATTILNDDQIRGGQGGDDEEEDEEDEGNKDIKQQLIIAQDNINTHCKRKNSTTTNDNEYHPENENNLFNEKQHNKDTISLPLISTATTTTTTSSSSSSSSNIFVTLSFLTCMIAIFTCIFYFSKNLISFLEMVEDLGIIGNIIFVASFLPTGLPLAIFSIYIPLTLSSGFVYGFLHGLATVSIGSTISATAGFWLTRKINLKWLESKIDSSPRLSSLRSMVDHHPVKSIIIIRLLPVLPFGIQNGLCAMTRVSYTTYIYSSIIGLLPENCLIAYVGTTLKTLSDITSGSKNPFTYYQQSLLVIAIVAGVILSIIGKRVLGSASLFINNSKSTITISNDDSTSTSSSTSGEKGDLILTINSSPLIISNLSSPSSPSSTPPSSSSSSSSALSTTIQQQQQIIKRKE